MIPTTHVVYGVQDSIKCARTMATPYTLDLSDTQIFHFPADYVCLIPAKFARAIPDNILCLPAIFYPCVVLLTTFFSHAACFLYTYVCMFVCMCVCMLACDVYTCMHLCICARTCVYVCVYVRMYACVW